MAIMNIRRNLLMLTSILPVLGACQTMKPADKTVTADEVFIARGNEPGWILKMDGKTIAYEGDYGKTKITIPAPVARPSFNGVRHVSDRLTVDVTYASCTDGMSGLRFADTVSVMADGKQVRGCGGRTLPPESLNETTWSIVMVNQLPVLEAIPAEVRFAGGKVTGTAGCNRFNGDYSATANALTLGPIASTRMMCPEKAMAQEADFLALFSGKLAIRYSVDGSLILSNGKGNQATLRQVP